MAIQLSPSVTIQELDLTSVVPAVATSVGAAVIEAAWGPVGEARKVDSENQLVAQFGKPNDLNAGNWFAAANFLSYASDLYISRSDTTNQRNAVTALTKGVATAPVTAGGTGYSSVTPPTITFTAPPVGITAQGIAVVSGGIVTGITITEPGTGYSTAPTASVGAHNGGSGLTLGTVTLSASGGIKINNQTAYTMSYASATNAVGEWAAKYPGSLGNSLKVSMADANAFSSWAYKSYFEGAPGTSAYAAAVNAANDELHIVVIDTTGKWSGVAGSVLEKFAYLSKASDARKPDGSGAYYKNVINDQSKYIYWMAHTTEVSASDAGVATPLVWGTAATSGTYGSMTDTQTGTITTTTGAATVTGVGTNFTVADVGRRIYNATGTYCGTISSVTSATAATMSANGAVAIAGAAFLMSAEVTVTLSGGVDHYTATDGQRQTAFDLFMDPETIDVNFLILGKSNTTVASYVVQSIAETRKDAIAFVSPQNVSSGDPIVGATSAEADKIVAYRNALPSSSYMVIDSGYKYQYDRYNDTYRWVPLNGDIAGLCARTDYSNDPWYSPAGYTRGQVKNVVKLAYSPRKTDRDTLYKNGVNPVVTFPGQGTILYGDKTGLSKPSAFDRINVRRLFIVLEKAIGTASKYQLFEINNEQTRAQFRAMVEPYLRDVQGRNGIYEFAVVCDSTNNTGEVIDNNRFVAQIFVKPARSINNIELTFVAQRTGSEITVTGA